MSIKLNILANYVAQLYSALIGILLMPLYVEYLGVEAYGLVGFYTMLQGWFMLLDMGLTPTIGREAARYKGGAIDALDLRQLLRALEGVFISIGVAGASVVVVGASFVATRWLKLEQLQPDDVAHAIMLMGVIVALRWVSGLYRGALGGFERIVWLSVFSVLIATLRFVLVIPFLLYVGSSPVDFFSYQLSVAIVEALVLVGQTYRTLPSVRRPIRLKWQPVRNVMPFALSSAFTSVVWVLVTQTDRFILSGLLPLTQYGYFSIAVLVASGVILLTSPISGALVPRLTRLSATGDQEALRGLYRQATQLAAVLATPLVLVLAFFPAQVLLAWTGKPDVASNAASILALYGIGNGILAFAAFPYYLQVAAGNLTIHVAGNVMFMLLYIPCLLLAVLHFGVLGAGYAWIAANLLPFATWLPLVHRRYLKGFHVDWLLRDIGSILLFPTLLAALLYWLLRWPSNTSSMVISLLVVYLGLTAAAAGSSSTIRSWLRARAH